jgi:two-component system phosphate regulon response regulator OmpR
MRAHQLLSPDAAGGMIMTEPVQILVVDDDADVREMLTDYLSGQGYRVLTADSGRVLRALLEEQAPHVVLLDVHMPGEDGLSLARYVRERFDIGIVMVSGAGSSVDRTIGLEIGADDYVSKPFDPRELLARIKSVLRRYQRAAPAAAPPSDVPANRHVQIGPCTLDLDARQMRGRDGAEIPLTSAEFELLKVLAERPNRPLTRDQILSLTQNRDWDPFDRSIDIRIARLRRKIEPETDKPRVIRTVRGVGYMYVPLSR